MHGILVVPTSTHPPRLGTGVLKLSPLDLPSITCYKQTDMKNYKVIYTPTKEGEPETALLTHSRSFQEFPIKATDDESPLFASLTQDQLRIGGKYPDGQEPTMVASNTWYYKKVDIYTAEEGKREATYHFLLTDRPMDTVPPPEGTILFPSGSLSFKPAD